MNQCRVLWLLVLTALFPSLTTAEISILPPDPGIDPTIKLDRVPDVHDDQILQQVTTELNKMGENTSDPAMVSMVRQWLVGEMQLEGGAGHGAVAPAYQVAYSKALNTAFMDALSKPDASPALKLNIGIVISQLSGRTVPLAPTVERLLGDKSPVVAMWGERAALAILPSGLEANGLSPEDRDKVLSAVVQAVKNHPESPMGGLIAEDAYKALTPDFNYPKNFVRSDDSIKALIATALDLQAARLKLYDKGVPESPHVDSFATGFFFNNPDNYALMSDAQKLQSVQQAANLISMAGQRIQGLASNMSGEIIQTIKSTGDWIKTLSMQTLHDPVVDAAVHDLDKISPSSSPDDIHKYCIGILVALRGQFPNLQDPPDLSAAKSAANN